MPSAETIRQWRRNFIQTGSVQDRSQSRRRRANKGNINAVHGPFTREPMKSICSAEDQLHTPRSTL